jgi:hypothetical protein
VRKHEQLIALWKPRPAKGFKVTDKPRRGTLPEILVNSYSD